MTIRESRVLEDLAEEFLYPSDNTPSPIGHICRQGKTIFYAYPDDNYYEAATAIEVAFKLASHTLEK